MNRLTKLRESDQIRWMRLPASWGFAKSTKFLYWKEDLDAHSPIRQNALSTTNARRLREFFQEEYPPPMLESAMWCLSKTDQSEPFYSERFFFWLPLLLESLGRAFGEDAPAALRAIGDAKGIEKPRFGSRGDSFLPPSQRWDKVAQEAIWYCRTRAGNALIFMKMALSDFGFNEAFYSDTGSWRFEKTYPSGSDAVFSASASLSIRSSLSFSFSSGWQGTPPGSAIPKKAAMEEQALGSLFLRVVPQVSLLRSHLGREIG